MAMALMTGHGFLWGSSPPLMRMYGSSGTSPTALGMGGQARGITRQRSGSAPARRTASSAVSCEMQSSSSASGNLAIHLR